MYAAEDLETQKPCALKVLRTEQSERPQAISRFEQEAQILSRLEHPSIVKALSFGGLGKNLVFIAMDLLEGETLRAYLDKKKFLEVTELKTILSQIASALNAAHAAHIVHRDLKPENIMIVQSPLLRAYVLDFGVSKLYGSAGITRTGEILGTPRYMAPEQLLGEKGIDKKVDVYALGVIVYEALTGHSPFNARHPAQWLHIILQGKQEPLANYRPDLPLAVQDVLNSATNVHKEERFESASAFYLALSTALNFQ